MPRAKPSSGDRGALLQAVQEVLGLGRVSVDIERFMASTSIHCWTKVSGWELAAS
jgi:hypothetical protein